MAGIRAEKVHYKFLYFNLIFLEKCIASLGTGSTFKAINKTQLANVEICNFPLHEQQKIAHILTTVQKAIEKQEEIIKTTTELKKAMMQKLFTEGLQGEPQKETEIGRIPKSWEVDTIGNQCRVTAGGTPRREKNENWKNGNIPWVKTGEIDYKVIYDTVEKITEEGLKNSSAKYFLKGTLLIAMYGQGITRGKVSILGINATTNQACAAIIPNNRKVLTIRYLYFYLEYSYEKIRRLSHGANQKNLSSSIIKTFKIPIPEEIEQKEISTKFNILDAKFENHTMVKRNLEYLFKSLLNQLMTGQLRVNDIDFPNMELD